MKVLIACEFSGIVREAFKARGHDAWSCDLLPTEIPGQHIQGDVLEILNDGWDLMIAHPPCTFLSYVGTRHWNKPGRKEKRDEAFDFFMNFANAQIEKICIENPKGYPMKAWRKPDQIIQPYFFGDREMKTTCLWLKGLSLLNHIAKGDMFDTPTHTDKPEPWYELKTNKKKIYFTEGMRGNKIHRSLARAKTFPGIATAMAEQWG